MTIHTQWYLHAGNTTHATHSIVVNSPIQSYIVLLIGSGHAQQAPQITFTTHATHSIVVNSPIQSYIVLLIGSGHAQQAPQITFTTDISETPIIVLLLSGLHFREQLMTTGYRSRGYYGLLSLLHTLSQQQPHSADFHIYTQYHILHSQYMIILTTVGEYTQYNFIHRLMTHHKELSSVWEAPLIQLNFSSKSSCMSLNVANNKVSM